MNRRKFLAAIAAGGVMTAEGLWVPGKKLISIPKGITAARHKFIVLLDGVVQQTVVHWSANDQITFVLQKNPRTWRG